MTDVPSSGLRVVVLSCGPLGYDVANRLDDLDEVASVTLITAEFRRKKLGSFEKIRHVHRYQGWPGLVSVVVNKLRPRGAVGGGPPPALADGIEHRHFDDFHSPECLAFIEAATPDLGVVAGTYILKESVFGIPRLGCINLHTGKAPEYRGAAPAFWEVFNGETEIGVTVHEVTADLDAGRILLQEVFPLDSSPPGDAMDHVLRTRQELLLPNGVRMLVEGVRSIAIGTAAWTSQDAGRARTYRTPDHKAKKELQQRVERRRRESGLLDEAGR